MHTLVHVHGRVHAHVILCVRARGAEFLTLQVPLSLAIYAIKLCPYYGINVLVFITIFHQVKSRAQLLP